ncbi:hypothetical protein [Terrarubrum flagellatum]|uniref:hypothetical protein n=1 Tax=Terrirubrum flagellatum TaxID=2895980 RepID=UPI0031456648
MPRSHSPLRKITLHLARTKDHPDGSDAHGYILVAPLTDEGRIDATQWRDNPAACGVTRFWGGEELRHGRLAHRPGGVNGATWTFDYDASTLADDEAGFRLGDHRLTPGEYLSIRSPDGDLRTFKVAKVEAV